MILTEKETQALKYIWSEWGEILEKVLNKMLADSENVKGIKEDEFKTIVSLASYEGKKDFVNTLINNFKNL